MWMKHKPNVDMQVRAKPNHVVSNGHIPVTILFLIGTQSKDHSASYVAFQSRFTYCYLSCSCNAKVKL